MKNFALIFRQEWKSFLHNPFALVIVPLFTALTGFQFYTRLTNYLNLTTPSDDVSVEGVSVMGGLLIPFFESMTFVLIFVIPLVTMRVFSEEKKQGTYDLLLSYPVRPWAILLGKYAGTLSICLAMFATSFVYVALVIWRGEPFMPQIGTIYLGYVLFILMYSAIGVVVSLYSENQILSALVTYIVLFATFLFGFLAFLASAPLDRVFSHFMVITHLKSFRSGLVYAGDIVLYPSLAALALLIGYNRLRRHYK